MDHGGCDSSGLDAQPLPANRWLEALAGFGRVSCGGLEEGQLHAPKAKCLINHSLPLPPIARPLTIPSPQTSPSLCSKLVRPCQPHSSRGRGAGKSAMEREAMVVRQIWEWWVLTFDLPLLHYHTPHTAACTAASILSTTTQPPSTQAPSAAPRLYYSSPIHGCRRAEEAPGGESEGDPHPGSMRSVRCCLRSYCVHSSAFMKPKVPS